MKNGDLPAMPSGVLQDGHNCGEYPLHVGLSKREELAARFMAAWIIHHGAAGGYGYSSKEAALGSIQDADVLLEELELTK